MTIKSKFTPVGGGDSGSVSFPQTKCFSMLIDVSDGETVSLPFTGDSEETGWDQGAIGIDWGDGTQEVVTKSGPWSHTYGDDIYYYFGDGAPGIEIAFYNDSNKLPTPHFNGSSCVESAEYKTLFIGCTSEWRGYEPAYRAGECCDVEWCSYKNSQWVSETSFYHLFGNGDHIGGLSPDLFQNNTSATSFHGCFEGTVFDSSYYPCYISFAIEDLYEEGSDEYNAFIACCDLSIDEIEAIRYIGLFANMTSSTLDLSECFESCDFSGMWIKNLFGGNSTSLINATGCFSNCSFTECKVYFKSLSPGKYVLQSCFSGSSISACTFKITGLNDGTYSSDCSQCFAGSTILNTQGLWFCNFPSVDFTSCFNGCTMAGCYSAFFTMSDGFFTSSSYADLETNFSYCFANSTIGTGHAYIETDYSYSPNYDDTDLFGNYTKAVDFSYCFYQTSGGFDDGIEANMSYRVFDTTEFPNLTSVEGLYYQCNLSLTSQTITIDLVTYNKESFVMSAMFECDALIHMIFNIDFDADVNSVSLADLEAWATEHTTGAFNEDWYSVYYGRDLDYIDVMDPMSGGAER